MQNPRLASRYAKSLLDLAVERNSLDTLLKDMQALNSVCHMSRDFEVMLRSPVISGDKKLAVVTAVLKSSNVSELMIAFINLLVSKGREQNIPEIAEAFIAQYNAMKNIKTIKLTTATPMNDTIQKSIAAKIASSMPGSTVDLKTSVDADLIGGFVLEADDKLYDASVRKSLNDIKAKVIDSSYVSKM